MKVRVKTWEEMLENDKVEEDSGDLIYDNTYDVAFVPEMKPLCGEVIELSDTYEYYDSNYSLPWKFESWMYDVVSEEESKPKKTSRDYKLEELEELGLERISHLSFRIPEEFFHTTNNSLPIPEIVIDFSATDQDRLVEYLIKKVFVEGVIMGKKEVSQQLNTILSYANEED